MIATIPHACEALYYCAVHPHEGVKHLLLGQCRRHGELLLGVGQAQVCLIMQRDVAHSLSDLRRLLPHILYIQVICLILYTSKKSSIKIGQVFFNTTYLTLFNPFSKD